MVAYRHGLRAVEAADLEWSRIEFGRNASPHVRRAKKGKPAVHPIRGDELRMLTALCKDGIFAAGDWRAERASQTISPSQRPEIGDHDAREMVAKRVFLPASCQLRVPEDWTDFNWNGQPVSMIGYR
jgi:integrase